MTLMARSLHQDALGHLGKNKLAMSALGGFVCFALIGIVGPWGWPYAFDEVFWESIAAPPTLEGGHFFGFDSNGRDLVARIISGLRTSLLVATVATSVSVVVGVGYGSISGFLGGRIDEMMMRLVDVLYALPSILFIILLQVIFGRHLLLLYIGIGLLEWITMARIVRGQTLSLKEKEFTEAAKALGRSPIQIVWTHIVPNLVGPVIIYATLTIPEIMLVESFLSFIGFGIQEDQGASLGTLISEGAQQIGNYWWMFIFPAAILAFVLLALIFIGEGLRDAFDPKGH